MIRKLMRARGLWCFDLHSTNGSAYPRKPSLQNNGFKGIADFFLVRSGNKITSAVGPNYDLLNKQVHMDLIISFDSSFSIFSDENEMLRRKGSSDNLTPVIRLVATNTLEHVGYLCKGNIRDRLLFAKVVSYTTILRDSAGILDAKSSLELRSVGMKVLSWLLGIEKWPMSPLLDPRHSLDLTDHEYESIDPHSWPLASSYSDSQIIPQTSINETADRNEMVLEVNNSAEAVHSPIDSATSVQSEQTSVSPIQNDPPAPGAQSNSNKVVQNQAGSTVEPLSEDEMYFQTPFDSDLEAPLESNSFVISQSHGLFDLHSEEKLAVHGKNSIAVDAHSESKSVMQSPKSFPFTCPMEDGNDFPKQFGSIDEARESQAVPLEDESEFQNQTHLIDEARKAQALPLEDENEPQNQHGCIDEAREAQADNISMVQSQDGSVLRVPQDFDTSTHNQLGTVSESNSAKFSVSQSPSTTINFEVLQEIDNDEIMSVEAASSEGTSLLLDEVASNLDIDMLPVQQEGGYDGLKDLELEKLRSANAGYQDAIGRLQDNYDEIREKLRSEILLKAEIEELQVQTASQLDSAKKRLNTALTQNLQLEEQSSRPKEKINRSSPAEQPYLELELESARLEIERMRRQVDSKSRDNAFFQNEYQQASMRAAELAGENSSLQSMIQDLKRSSSGEATKLRGLQFSHEARAWKQRADELEATNTVLLEQIRRMEGEMVPRSRSRFGARRGLSPISRGASPVVAPYTLPAGTAPQSHPLQHVSSNPKI